MPCLRLNVSRENSQGFCLPLWPDTFLAHFRAKPEDQNHSDILLMLMFCVFLPRIRLCTNSCGLDIRLCDGQMIRNDLLIPHFS